MTHTYNWLHTQVKITRTHRAEKHRQIADNQIIYLVRTNTSWIYLLRIAMGFRFSHPYILPSNVVGLCDP
jgi:hypothetical protein